jgi:MHS family proline/betaine transporter-like MFS transporter
MSKPKSVFISAVSGNILEYYDFTVYSVFAKTIGQTFFPSTSEISQILASLAVFAVGFITRPIGGIFFGYVGDKYGRRTSLIISMLGMTIPTFTIGMIPSYEAIGLYAPLLLVLMRLLQGLCISGEGAGAAIFILEHHQNLKPGLTAGLVHGSNIAGTLMATFVGIIIAEYYADIDFAWRFAFLLGGFMGMVGFYLRLRVSETPIFQMLAEKKKTLKTPILGVFTNAWRPMFVTFCIGAAASSMLYLIKTYVNIFYNDIMHYDSSSSLAYMSFTSFVSMLAMPLFGGLSDVFGKLRMVVIASLLILLLAFPTLIVMSSPSLVQQLFALAVLGILGGGISGCAYIFIISLFKPEEKFFGVAFSYNLGIAMFGGTSAFISRWLVETTGKLYTPAFYIMATSSVFLLIIYVMRKTIINLLNEKT